MPDSPAGPTDGGRTVHFEETLSIRDESGARRLIGFTRVAVLFLVVFTLASIVLVVVNKASMFTSATGGIEVVVTVLEAVRSERPLAFVGLPLLFVVLPLLVGLLLIVGFLRAMGRTFDERIHVRVTDTGVTVERDGSRYWQSSGVEMPFDAITAVEYLDPEESPTRIELADWRAQRFFAGRSRNWIRLERGNGPTVYIGSDRPIELAETIARRVPGIENAEPF